MGAGITGRAARIGDRGAAAVEFALILPLLAAVIFGITDAGRALESQLIITRAAQDGARAAALGQTGVQQQVQSDAQAAGPVSVTVVPCLVGTPAATVTVTCVVPMTIIPGISPVVTLTAAEESPCEP